MDYYSAFEISASGMSLERVRLDILAQNLANANTTRTEDGGVYRPLRVISQAKDITSFHTHMSQLMQNGGYPGGVEITDILPQNVEPRLIFEPEHPHANSDGFVSYPNINPVSEMVTLIEAVRGYEANVRALNAAKSMALSALEIGKQQ
ncbi:flagellar basal body rod protein FlgC [Candidatus Thiodiazotropha endoloripes]|nr:flagellar basal body rod protein FlgC [Candidatus Thiodiazotropha endoloripes]